MWFRSGGEHSDPELTVEVWRGTLRSRACSGGRKEEGGGGQADTKSTNPHLTGGEKGIKRISCQDLNSERNFIRTHGPVSFGSVNLIEALVRARHSDMGASKVRP